jgi:hypothetical protein
LANASYECRDELHSNLRVINKAIEAGVLPRRAAAANSAWGIWQRLCISLGIGMYLNCGTDPLIILLFFAER